MASCEWCARVQYACVPCQEEDVAGEEHDARVELRQVVERHQHVVVVVAHVDAGGLDVEDPLRQLPLAHRDGDDAGVGAAAWD